MATMQKERLRPLTIAEQGEVQAIIKASSERLDRVQRATAVLAVAGGAPFSAAARAAGYHSPQAVTYLARRFNRVGLAALDIATGRGRRPTYDAAARARIVATAQRAPDRKADGTAMNQNQVRIAWKAVGADVRYSLDLVLRDGSSIAGCFDEAVIGSATSVTFSGICLSADERLVHKSQIAELRLSGTRDGLVMHVGRLPYDGTSDAVEIAAK